MDKFNAIAGKGVEALYGEKRLLVGNMRFMRDYQIQINDEIKRHRKTIEDKAETPIYFSIDEEIKALLGVSDQIKDGSYSAIKQLNADGKK